MIRMDAEEKRLVISTVRPGTLHEFMDFWATKYFYDDQKLHDLEKLYSNNIRGPHRVETLTELFKWKMGVYASVKKIRSGLEQNFLSKIEKAAGLPPDISAKDFLQVQFPNGGVIARIFWLHCWYPKRFPIYDQHVHRAMVFLRTGQVNEADELGNLSDKKKIEQYLQYVDFFERFRAVSEELFDNESDGVPGRKADRALVTFGFELRSKTFREMI